MKFYNCSADVYKCKPTPFSDLKYNTGDTTVDTVEGTGLISSTWCSMKHVVVLAC